MAVMGMDHPEGMLHDSPAGLPQSLKQHFDLSIYHARRGILVARTDYSDGALYFHFDARPDSIVVGHDNADRGVITLSALGRTWLDELPWRDFFVSQVHSLMHVDGQAQGVKAPAVRMLKVSDENGVVLAAADLTYAYNTRYAQAWSTADPPFHWEFEFIDGKPEERQIVYSEKETGNIKDFGWPKGDDSSDIGFMDDTKMFDEADIGFSGIYTWKRKYRQVSLLHAVRSTALVRSNRGSSYVIVGDDFAMSGSGKHSFEMYLILAPGVAISNSSKCDTQPCVCKTKPCTIQLDGGESTFLTVHASTLGDQVSYSIEPIEDTGSSRLIIASGGSNFEKFCTVLHPHEDVTGSSKISVRRTAHNVCAVREEGAPTERAFRFMDENHTFETYTIPFVDISGQPAYEPPSPAPTSPPPSPSAAASSKPTVSATPTKSSVLYVSPTPSKSALPKQSATPTPDPVEEVGGGGDDDGWDGSDWDDDGAWEDDGWGDDYDSWGDDDDDWGDDDDDDAWGDDDDWGGDGFYGGGGAGAGTYPLDAWLLQKAAKTDYYEEELVLGKDQFYSPTASYKAELGLYVTADGTSEKRTITTCFPETTAITQITVWNCGHPDYAHDTFYYRDCTEISRDAAAGTHEGCENKDVFTFQEEQNSMYFIVVGADRKGSTRMDFAIKYE